VFQRLFTQPQRRRVIPRALGIISGFSQVLQAGRMARRAGVVGGGVGPAHLGLGNLTAGIGGAGH